MLIRWFTPSFFIESSDIIIWFFFFSQCAVETLKIRYKWWYCCKFVRVDFYIQHCCTRWLVLLFPDISVLGVLCRLTTKFNWDNSACCMRCPVKLSNDVSAPPVLANEDSFIIHTDHHCYLLTGLFSKYGMLSYLETSSWWSQCCCTRWPTVTFLQFCAEYETQSHREASSWSGRLCWT